MPYTVRTQVQPADIDELGHASNVVYLRWTQDAAVQHSQAMGLGMAEYVARGAVFVVRRHVVDYLRPAMLGDELDVTTQVSATTPATAERSTTIRRVADGAVLAKAHTVWAYVDLARARPARIPAEVLQKFPIEPAVQT
jgi:acyl-CoA thioester hydrolase